jgi:hypothetical protein
MAGNQGHQDKERPIKNSFIPCSEKSPAHALPIILVAPVIIATLSFMIHLCSKLAYLST